jgi:hypothetical protein
MKTISKTSMAAIITVIAVVSVVASVPVASSAKEMGNGRTAIQLAQFGCQMVGPFATMGRANEIAGQARSIGYSAVAFHNGDRYYVRVCT